MGGYEMDKKHLAAILWIVKACLLALMLGAGLQAVVGYWHPDTVLDPGTTGKEPQAAGTSGLRPPTPLSPDYATIVQRNLFAAASRGDDSPASPSAAQPPDSAALAEELGLRLVGTIAGGPATSRAIFQNTKSKVTRPYRIGDTVAAATVTAIQRDTVVLDYRGRSLVVTRCPGTTETGGQPGEQGRQKPPEAASLAEGPGGPSSSAVVSSSETSGMGYVAEIFRKATIEPYVTKDRTEGLRITGLENLPAAQRYGFRNGDVVQSVNGQPLTSKQKAFQVLAKARTLPKVDIRLLREGKSRELSFKL
jgi:type II secretion system protein C